MKNIGIAALLTSVFLFPGAYPQPSSPGLATTKQLRMSKSGAVRPFQPWEDGSVRNVNGALHNHSPQEVHRNEP